MTITGHPCRLVCLAMRTILSRCRAEAVKMYRLEYKVLLQEQLRLSHKISSMPAEQRFA